MATDTFGRPIKPRAFNGSDSTIMYTKLYHYKRNYIMVVKSAIINMIHLLSSYIESRSGIPGVLEIAQADEYEIINDWITYSPSNQTKDPSVIHTDSENLKGKLKHHGETVKSKIELVLYNLDYHLEKIDIEIDIEIDTRDISKIDKVCDDAEIAYNYYIGQKDKIHKIIISFFMEKISQKYDEHLVRNKIIPAYISSIINWPAFMALSTTIQINDDPSNMLLIDKRIKYRLALLYAYLSNIVLINDSGRMHVKYIYEGKGRGFKATHKDNLMVLRKYLNNIHKIANDSNSLPMSDIEHYLELIKDNNVIITKDKLINIFTFLIKHYFGSEYSCASCEVTDYSDLSYYFPEIRKFIQYAILDEEVSG